jgi:hypothetical protein
LFSFRLRDRSKGAKRCARGSVPPIRRDCRDGMPARGPKQLGAGAWMAEAFDAVALELLNLGRT